MTQPYENIYEQQDKYLRKLNEIVEKTQDLTDFIELLESAEFLKRRIEERASEFYPDVNLNNHIMEKLRT